MFFYFFNCFFLNIGKYIEEKYIQLSHKNKEIIEENASLLSQIETLKKEKTEIYQKFFHLMPKQNLNKVRIDLN